MYSVASICIHWGCCLARIPKGQLTRYHFRVFFHICTIAKGLLSFFVLKLHNGLHKETTSASFEALDKPPCDVGRAGALGKAPCDGGRSGALVEFHHTRDICWSLWEVDHGCMPDRPGHSWVICHNSLRKLFIVHKSLFFTVIALIVTY